MTNLVEQIDEQIARLQQARKVLTGNDSSVSFPVQPAAKKTRTFSAATRAKMAEAQRARWAKKGGGK